MTNVFGESTQSQCIEKTLIKEPIEKTIINVKIKDKPEIIYQQDVSKYSKPLDSLTFPIPHNDW